MNEVTDQMLIAYADGELDAAERARVGQAIGGDPALAARLDAQRRLRARLAAHYGPAAEEEVPARLRSLIETGVVDLAEIRARRARPLWQSFTALAATLVLGLFLGRMALTPGGPIGVEDGAMVAQGALAEALDSQLASTQAPDAATRIGLSFAAADGRICRTFEGAALAGLACRSDDGWQLMTTAAGRGPSADYRQAGSADPLVLQAAQALMAGEPFDAEGERRARDSGWRRSGASR